MVAGVMGESTLTEKYLGKDFAEGMDLISFAAGGAQLAEAIGAKIIAKSSTLTITAKAEDTVSVFHGSINDATAIRANGLSAQRGTAFVSRDLKAAQDAIGKARYEVDQGAARDIGIIESRIPRADFDRCLAPVERSYSGFQGAELRSSEIPLRTPDLIDLFNRYRVTGP